MKKLLSLLTLAGALILTACENENTVNPTDELGSATITGTVFAELDQTDADLEFAPAGTRVVVIVDTRDFVLNPTGANYALRYYEGEVGSNGTYSIDIETGNYPLEVAIVPADFSATVITGAGNETQTFIGAGAGVNADVYPGGSFIVDLTYP